MGGSTGSGSGLGSRDETAGSLTPSTLSDRLDERLRLLLAGLGDRSWSSISFTSDENDDDLGLFFDLQDGTSSSSFSSSSSSDSWSC